MATTGKQKATVPPRALIRNFWAIHKTIVRSAAVESDSGGRGPANGSAC